MIWDGGQTGAGAGREPRPGAAGARVLAIEGATVLARRARIDVTQQWRMRCPPRWRRASRDVAGPGRSAPGRADRRGCRRGRHPRQQQRRAAARALRRSRSTNGCSTSSDGRAPVPPDGLLLPGMRSRGWAASSDRVSGVEQPIRTGGCRTHPRLGLGWAKTLAGEVAADGVTVTSWLPGRGPTDRVDQLDAAAPAKLGKSVARWPGPRCVHPGRRYGRPGVR